LDFRAPREADDPSARDVKHEIVQARRSDRELLISEVGETVREYVLWFQSYCKGQSGKQRVKSATTTEFSTGSPRSDLPLSAFVSQAACRAQKVGNVD
jgi:hypothetical protein